MVTDLVIVLVTGASSKVLVLSVVRQIGML